MGGIYTEILASSSTTKVVEEDSRNNFPSVDSNEDSSVINTIGLVFFLEDGQNYDVSEIPWHVSFFPDEDYIN